MANVSAPYPWLEGLWKDVVQRLEAGRLPHALLLAGPPGWGQWELACALARRILHLAAGADRADAIVHPDFRLVTIEEGKRQILVDQVRALNEFVSETASAGGAKVAIVSPAEALNQNAANALLKLLEEPAGHTHLLLTSHAAGRLLPTIVSRCQRVRLGAQGAEQARAWLHAQVGPGSETDAAMFYAGGAPLAALELLEEGALEDAQGLERSLLDPRAETTAVTRLGDAHSLERLLDWWLRIALRWQREHRGAKETFEFVDLLLRCKAESVAVPLNSALVIESLHRRWCDLVHIPEHSN